MAWSAKPNGAALAVLAIFAAANSQQAQEESEHQTEESS